MTTAARPAQLRAVRGPVALSADTGHGFAEIVNMSGTGALLTADRPMQVGEVLFMRFVVPGAAEVTAEARVARVENGTAGVAFRNLDQHDAEMIVRHVMRGQRPRG